MSPRRSSIAQSRGILWLSASSTGTPADTWIHNRFTRSAHDAFEAGELLGRSDRFVYPIEKPCMESDKDTRSCSRRHPPRGLACSRVVSVLRSVRFPRAMPGETAGLRCVRPLRVHVHGDLKMSNMLVFKISFWKTR